MKICTVCLKEKPLYEYGVHKGAPDGKRARCKVCYNSEERDEYKSFG